MSDRPFIPSPQQIEFFNFVQDPSKGSGILEAVAGAGKTETLARAMGMMRGSVAAMAFNRKAAQEIKDRVAKLGLMRQGLFISTAHGAGYSTWRRAAPYLLEPNENKVRDLIDRFAMEQPQPGVVQEAAPVIRRLVSLGKQMLAGVKWNVSNVNIWMKIIDHHSLDSELSENIGPDKLVEWTQVIFKKSGDMCRELIDFDDMIWAPLAYNARFFTNDWVVGDEWQDTNPARRELARRMLKHTGRFLGAGDRHQAIYGFTGADADALDLTKQEFNADYLPLTVTYRCPKAVVNHVHQWVSHIDAHPDAPEGEVTTFQSAKDGKPQPWFLVEKPGQDDAILCRYTKPLVSTAYALIKNRIACRVEGRDIGLGLIALAKRWKVKTLDALETRLKAWEAREIAKARKQRSEAKERIVTDKADTLRVFIEMCRDAGDNSLACVVQRITDLFADDVTGCLTLATGHKAKGREWPNVYWLQQAIRTRRELKPHEQQQEDNICYVIGTRAKTRLVLIPESAQ